MRNLLVKYLALSYDSKVFGTTFVHLRVVNILMPLFCLAGLFNLLTRGFDFWQGIAFAPFVAVFLVWLYYFKANPVRRSEMDWEQEFQHLKNNAGGLSEENDLSKLRKRWKAKYKGREKFVEVWRFLIPYIAIGLSLLIYKIWGFAEAGFSPSRFF